MKRSVHFCTPAADRQPTTCAPHCCCIPLLTMTLYRPQVVSDYQSKRVAVDRMKWQSFRIFTVVATVGMLYSLHLSCAWLHFD